MIKVTINSDMSAAAKEGETHHQEFRRLESRNEFEAWIAEYPRELSHNFFMDEHSWHDFARGDLSVSCVAKACANYGGSENTYWVLPSAFI